MNRSTMCNTLLCAALTCTATATPFTTPAHSYRVFDAFSKKLIMRIGHCRTGDELAADLFVLENDITPLLIYAEPHENLEDALISLIVSYIIIDSSLTTEQANHMTSLVYKRCFTAFSEVYPHQNDIECIERSLNNIAAYYKVLTKDATQKPHSISTTTITILVATALMLSGGYLLMRQH